ncbi:restriction endonuclease subunit S [Pontibacter sp. FD36]|uniref:restriction endonuclease subunit S n=1 Tax=Pontibacter sp. FD36 TaxID=2789860 RepID=UPI0018AAA4E1|nr:restriction endonuclease subunit S [Pontibacter sp. FD36]MBF8964055.1 restriction endonuclease subunit S [Pontibacter sp. FD36]
MGEWKETEIGQLPLHWDTQSIENLIEDKGIAVGVMYPGEFVANGVPLIRAGDIRNGKIDTTNICNITEEVNATYKRTILQGGELLVVLVGAPGLSVVVPEQMKNWNVARAVGVLKLKDKSDARYISYAIQSPGVKHLLLSSCNTTVQATLNLKELKQILIPWPEKSERKAITSVLKSLDDKINLLHRQNAALEAMAETLFRKWFVVEAKENWEGITLYDAIELIGGGTPKTSVAEYWNGNIKWLSGGDISTNHKSIVITSEKTITEEGLRNSSAKLLPKFATVISARGTVGKYCILSEPMAFSQSNYGIKPKVKDCYFFTYLLVNHSVEELNSAAYGSVFDTITTNTFKGIKISIPSEDEIRGFENEVSAYFFKLLNNQSQIQVLTNLRDTLLPKLMSGQATVELQPQPEEASFF